jgi:hypothetical protein
MIATSQDSGPRVNREKTRKRAEAAEGALLIWFKELITPCDRCIHRLLTLWEIPWTNGRKQNVVFESAEQILCR